jgi:integrase
MGTILTRQLKDGTTRYVVMYDITPDPITGNRRQRKQVCNTRTEAKRLLQAKQQELSRGIVIESSSLTVAELMRDWLQSHGHDLRPKTLADYEHRINLHVIPALGHIPIQKLTPAHVQNFIDAKRKAGVGTRTLQLCHLNLSQALKRAVALDLVSRNVADVVKRPRHAIREMHCWTADEAKRFLAVADQSSRGPIWSLALATGMRRGELLGLRWEDVNFDQCTVQVRQSAIVARGVTIISKPKTASLSADDHGTTYRYDRSTPA